MGGRSDYPVPMGGMKRDFANRARAFAKWFMGLRMVPEMPLAALAIALVATLGGAFGTAGMPPPHRLAFWLILMGWNAAKWITWLSWRVRKPGDWWPAALIGTVVLNLTLPLEIGLGIWIVGEGMLPSPFSVWSRAAALAGVILLVMVARHPPWRKRPRAPEILTRAGSRPERLLAVTAEDHYCRLYEEGGEQRLVHARFGDVLAELEELDGSRIHRGAWVADRAVSSARRSGRGWELVLPCGTALKVSATHRQEARSRGWLAR